MVAYPLQASDVSGEVLHAQLGPSIELKRPLDFVPDQQGGGVELSEKDLLVIAEDLGDVRDLLPIREMTVSAWVSVVQPRQWGGVLGCIQDNDDAETDGFWATTTGGSRSGWQLREPMTAMV